MAHSDASEGRSNFQQSSVGVASALKLAIQREEELAVSASTFFADNPKASPAEFSRWVKWARTLHRFPELDRLGLVTLVRKPQLPAFEAQLSGHALKPANAATAAAGALEIVPASDHHYYCLAAAELVRSAALTAPAGLDYCAQSPALLEARDHGRSLYTPVSVGGNQALTHRHACLSRQRDASQCLRSQCCIGGLATRGTAAGCRTRTGPGRPPCYRRTSELPRRWCKRNVYQWHHPGRRTEHHNQPAQRMDSN